MKPFVTDIRVFDMPLREWISSLTPTRQDRLRLLVFAVLVAVGTVVDHPLIRAFSVCGVFALGIWILVGPIRRTPEEQQQYDRMIDEDVRAMLEACRKEGRS